MYGSCAAGITAASPALPALAGRIGKICGLPRNCRCYLPLGQTVDCRASALVSLVSPFGSFRTCGGMRGEETADGGRPAELLGTGASRRPPQADRLPQHAERPRREVLVGDRDPRLADHLQQA